MWGWPGGTVKEADLSLRLNLRAWEIWNLTVRPFENGLRVISCDLYIFKKHFSSYSSTLPYVMAHCDMCLALIKHHVFALVLKAKAIVNIVEHPSVFSVWKILSITMLNWANCPRLFFPRFVTTSHPKGNRQIYSYPSHKKKAADPNPKGPQCFFCSSI